ncbi:MAG: DUF3343 domain-containing protein [Elusimicrobiota bacterium]|nr:DUF3343 domain-containing protein [Elusimicrobiota bacterium]
MVRYIITFENTYRVIEAEKKLKGKFKKVTTIPTPEDLSTDCGVSLSLETNKNRQELADYLKDANITFSKIVKK